ncbi:9000_t:CDS:10 [Scutellospora calospora]|uniref:9000_t:CDS:1 n=1 Tax=Scutellospora calospora TaxID=85575 RepID=A0ACA9JVA8_9GLOM|nr:9000_t:CDS:10 [Scutellospora calospora]
MSTPNYSLKVDIIKARNLAIKDRNGFSDPYIVMHIGDENYNTHVVNKNLNPEWDATFCHKIDPQHPPSEIHFTCWDKDIFGKDYMGEIIIPLERFCEKGHIGYNDELNTPQWYPLISHRQNEKVSGEVNIKIGFVDKDNDFLDSREWISIWKQMHHLSITEPSDTISITSTIASVETETTVTSTTTESTVLYNNNTVTLKRRRYNTSPQASEVLGLAFIEVVRAIDLPAEKNVTGLDIDMDPFVVISFAKNTFRTRVIKHSLDPVWNEKIHFPVKTIETDFIIKFSVYDWDKISTNDLVASKILPIKELMDLAHKNTSKLELQNIGDGMEEKEIPLEVYGKFANICKSKLVVRLKFVPYEVLRSQFWCALAKIYDSDENGVLNFVEIETMLSSLGSSLTNETISGFFTRFGKNPKTDELEFSELTSCLEERLSDFSQRSADINGEESDNEHIVYIKECPICHKPDLAHLTETNVVTHVAICASNDWGEVNKFVTGDFVTESQAQRKWLSKIISKEFYGSFRIGANSAIILAQDRKTGQMVEEKMATYVRLGIRLLYKGKHTVESKTTKNLLKKLTEQQGKKFNKPTSVGDIKPFIEFHGLDTGEILDPLDSFKNFNEFFYRKLKPTARSCDSPDDPHVVVSPADCRMMCFPTISEATELWIKGQNFTLSKLLNDDEMSKEFEEGSLGIFRLAPQDYHRFHIPVEGTLSEPKEVSGDYYTVNPMAIRSDLDVYCVNKRVISYIDSPQFGKVAYVSIGAMMVGSIILTSEPHTYVKRLEEHGYFAFGGSTVVLLFQKGRMFFDKDILENSTQCLETLVCIIL